MYRILLLVIVLSISLRSNATLLRVGPEAGSYNTIHTAVNASAASDTIVLSAHSESYSLDNADLVLIHPLHFYGAGWPTSSQLGSKINLNGHRVFIQAGASGSSFEGISVEGANACSGCSDTAYTAFILESGASNLLFQRILHRCAGHQYSYQPYYYGVFLWAQGSNHNIRILQCAMYSGINNGNSAGNALKFSGGNSSAIIQNCVFANVWLPISFAGSLDLSFHQNVIWTCGVANLGDQTTGSVTNNIFYSVGLSPYGVDFLFNAGTGSGFGSDWITLNESPFMNLPIGTIWVNDQYDLHLQETSSCVDAGVLGQTDRDGSRADLGIYGGLYPYIKSGIPDFPFVTSLSIPASTPQNGVIPIYSTGRVGE